MNTINEILNDLSLVESMGILEYQNKDKLAYLLEKIRDERYMFTTDIPFFVEVYEESKSGLVEYINLLGKSKKYSDKPITVSYMIRSAMRKLSTLSDLQLTAKLHAIRDYMIEYHDNGLVNY